MPIGTRRTTLITKQCQQCGITFTRSLAAIGIGKFCSRRCSGNYGRAHRDPSKTALVDVNCAGCGVTFKKWRHELALSTSHYCSRRCRKIAHEDSINFNKLRDVIYERAPKCEHCGAARCAICGSVRCLQVHHRNGKHCDNRLTNLILLCAVCHHRAHKDLAGGVHPVHRRRTQAAA